MQSLIFQREVLSNIIPSCNPSLIQTHDWMTGLIPPLVSKNIKTLHTVHNTHSFYSTLEDLENAGLSVKTEKFYKDVPWGNIVDFQMSGIYGSDHIALVSENWLEELIEGKGINGSPKDFCQNVRKKALDGKARGILNAPDPSYMPEIDKSLAVNFSNDNNMCLAKLENKINFQNTFDRS